MGGSATRMLGARREPSPPDRPRPIGPAGNGLSGPIPRELGDLARL